MNPQDLKKIMSSGLLSFPLTDFHENGDFNAKTYAARLEWLAPYGASALFAAGGTGEYFSLTGQEYPEVIKTAVQTCKGNTHAKHIGYKPLDSSEPYRAKVEAEQPKLDLTDPAVIYQGGGFVKAGPF
jgi:Dihydrodipicolinate synthetase family